MDMRRAIDDEPEDNALVVNGIVPGSTTPLFCLRLSRYAVGVLLLVVVAVIWVVASLWIQYIYGSLHYDKPYFITYLNTSMFALYNVGYFAFPSWRQVPWAFPGEVEDEPFFSAPHRSSGEPTADETDSPSPRLSRRYSKRELIRCAMFFCPMWFLANVLFNYSLDLTSVSTNTILSTTSSVHTLIFARVFLRTPVGFTKLLAMFLSVGGTVMVAIGDTNRNPGQDTVSGYVTALTSAVFYAAYTTTLRFFLPDEARYSMPMVFGMVGIVNLVLFWPGFFILNATGTEKFEWPSLSQLWPLVVNSLIGTNLSDVLWAKAVVLTSPFVATLGLSLTTPFAMVAGAIVNHAKYSLLYIAGALVVTGGFVVSNFYLRAK
jgi:solute carrier family 35 protein F5